MVICSQRADLAENQIANSSPSRTTLLHPDSKRRTELKKIMTGGIVALLMTAMRSGEIELVKKLGVLDL